MKLRFYLAVLCCIFSIFPAVGHSQSLPPKVLFEGVTTSVPWKIVTTEGASQQTVKNGVAFTIDAWQQGRDMWPRLQLTGSAIDLSDYSMISVDIENPTANGENIVLESYDSPITASANRAVQSYTLPPKTVSTITLKISGGKFDSSNMTRIILYLTRPLTASTYILRKVSAVTNPDYPSARAETAQLLAEADDNVARFQNATNFQQALDSAHQLFSQRSPGYIAAIAQALDTLQQDMTRLGMESRKTDLLIWTSPLGLAIRNGTLPAPADQALSQISKRLCLNEYEAICVNISAAEKPQTVKVLLDQKSAPDNLITLRPTLFAKARDGSQTADAIGNPCTELSLNVEPFQTQQFIVWVDTKTKNSKSGQYNAALQISAPGRTQTIPVQIKVENLRLPDALPFSIINWAKFYEGPAQVTKGLEKEAVQNLRDYGVNTWLIDYDQVPLPLLDSAGKYIGLNATDRNRVQRFRQLMDLLKGNPQENFVVFLGFQRPEVKVLLSGPGVLKAYLKDLHALLDEYHVPIEKRYIEFWDEPSLAQVAESVPWMKKIRAIDASWQFFDDNSNPPLDKNLFDDYNRLIGKWMPNWDQFFLGRPEQAKKLEALKTSGFGFYRCLMTRNNRGVNIYEYYRLMSWYLMQHGFDSVGFWTYNHGAGENVWDGTTGSSSGGVVVYNKDGKLLTSRRWELFREGLEDYKLAQAAFGNKNILNAGKNPRLKNLCEQVIDHPDDYRQADAVREKLIDLALQRGAP